MREESFCRLTVLAPRRRVDVALPADVPVADLVPMVLELVGEPGPERARRPEPWRLSGAAGGPLPVAATLGELGVLDGELLRLAPDAPPPVPPVFDDPVDALAATAGTSQDVRRSGAAVVLLVAAVAAGLVVIEGSVGSGDGPVLAALVAGAGAVAAVAGAARLVRAAVADDRWPPVWSVARALAGAGAGLAAAAGWAGAAALSPPVALLVAAVAGGTVAAAAQVAVRVVAPALVAAGIVALVTAGAALAVVLGADPAAAATGAGMLALAGGPLLPRVALRLSGLPRPVVAADGSDLVAADAGPDVLPPAELAERADLARGLLAGLAGGTAAATAVAAVAAGASGGWAGWAFAGVAVAVLGLRARGYSDPGPTRATAAAAIAAALALAVLAAGSGGVARPLAALALLAVAAAGAAVLAAAARGRALDWSPVARRSVDLLEGVLLAASVPLGVAAMDLFRIVRGL